MNTETALLERWLWLATSLGLAMLAGAVGWFLGRPRSRGGAPHFPGQTLLANPWLIQPLRLLYAVGIPALAFLWRGVLTPSGLGLQQFFWDNDQVLEMAAGNWDNWVRDIGWTFALAGGFGLMILIADHTTRSHIAYRRFDIALREAVYHQVHWAFYREPFVLWLGTGLGAWGGLALVAIEAFFNPARWTDLQSPARGRGFLIRVGLAVLSTLLFIQTQNLWLAIIADTMLGWLLGQTQERPESNH